MYRAYMSVAQALGEGPRERVVVGHIDDSGISEAVNPGVFQVLDETTTCDSVMVPCPVFESENIQTIGRHPVRERM